VAAALPALGRVIGHRGAAGRAPENTLAGFRRASELGCRWIEFDVRLTADGAPVLCHDPTLDRTTTGRGRISALSLAAVRACDAGARLGTAFAGEKVPTLREALAVAAELGLGADIEIKSDPGREYATAAMVAANLREQGEAAPQLLISSFSLPVMAALSRLAPDFPRVLLFRLIPRNWAELMHSLGCIGIGADHRRLLPRRVAEIRDAGYPLLAYTVNDPARARLLFRWGVTSVFSDLPDIISREAASDRPVRHGVFPLHSETAPRQGAMR
jgi:glycerophosphoryl diester phosphodiesterase